MDKTAAAFECVGKKKHTLPENASCLLRQDDEDTPVDPEAHAGSSGAAGAWCLVTTTNKAIWTHGNARRALILRD